MKKFTKILVAAFMVLSLAACSSNKASNDDNNATGKFDLEALQGTEVSIWHTFTNDQLTTLEAIAKEFNETNEYGITVKVESQTYDGFLDTVKNNVYNMTGPDMIINYASAAADYVTDEKVVDLAPYVYDEEIGIPNYKNNKPAGVIAEECGFEDGGMHVLVTQQTGPIFFYNKTLYDELGLKAPTTWDELEANAKKIYEEKNIIGFAIDSITDVTQTLIKQKTDKYIDTEARKIAFNNAETEQIVNFIADGCKDGYFSINPSNGYFSSDMTAGIVGSYIGSVAGLPYVKGKGIFGENDNQELAFAPLPLEGTKWTPAWDRGVIVFDYENEARALASYLFVKYFTSDENSARWNMAMNSISPFLSVQQTASFQEYLNSNAALKALSEQTEFAGVLPTINGSATVRTELQNAVKAVAAGEQTAAEALKECEENSNAALAK